MICEKCGTEMIEIKSSFSAGMECPKCKWGWVTTNTDPFANDNTDYEIWLEPGNNQNPNIIKLIADVADVNFVQAKRILSSNSAERIYKARNEAVATMHKAQRVQANAKRLKEAGLAFTITPDFPYEV